MEEIKAWLPGDKVIPAIEWCLDTVKSHFALTSGSPFYTEYHNYSFPKIFIGEQTPETLAECRAACNYLSIIDTDYEHKLYTIAIMFCFEDPKEALMFKLKWC